MDTAQPGEQAFRVVVFADFVCPYSYLAVEQIDRLAHDYAVKPQWRPYWLHPETPPEGTPRERTPEALARRAQQQAWLAEMAPDQSRRMHLPEKRQYSFRAFEALEFAYECGLDAELKTALYEIMWEEGRDIGDVETLRVAGERAGLDADALIVALETRLFAEQALDAIKQARELGITNTPTIFLGRTRINGWHYYEVLQSVMDRQHAPRRECVAA